MTKIIEINNNKSPVQEYD